MIKDHYQILEIAPSASLPEIKKAYRRLALLYHPDKNPGDPYAREQFNSIKEAYEVLSNPGKKQRYLEQRWYQQSSGLKRTRTVTTPVTVLKQVLELDKYVSSLDVHRMDKDGLFNYIREIVSNDTIAAINSFNEPTTNREIIFSLLKSCSLLPYMQQKFLYNQLGKIEADTETRERIHNWSKISRQVYLWESWRPWLIAGVVVLLIVLIVFAV